MPTPWFPLSLVPSNPSWAEPSRFVGAILPSIVRPSTALVVACLALAAINRIPALDQQANRLLIMGHLVLNWPTLSLTKRVLYLERAHGQPLHTPSSVSRPPSSSLPAVLGRGERDSIHQSSPSSRRLGPGTIWQGLNSVWRRSCHYSLGSYFSSLTRLGRQPKPKYLAFRTTHGHSPPLHSTCAPCSAGRVVDTPILGSMDHFILFLTLCLLLRLCSPKPIFLLFPSNPPTPGLNIAMPPSGPIFVYRAASVSLQMGFPFLFHLSHPRFDRGG